MRRLRAIVLGSAAGGGFPQWNCRCPACQLAWSGDRRVKSRTQASLAVSANGEDWLLINASPDLPEQIRRSPALHPGGGKGGNTRGSPIKSILLTGAEIDQVTGLLSLREREPFTLCASAATHAVVRANSVFDVLAADVVERRTIELDQPCTLPGDLVAELFAVPGKVPLYLEGENPETMSETAGTVGAEISAGGARLVYIPGAAAITPRMRKRLDRADVVFFDGTLFRDDEMIVSGTGSKTSRRMGHMSIGGTEGTLEALRDLKARRIFIHINNTNPILVDGSPEHARVVREDWEIAEDGMEVML
jgi:pyrroloquinoline quinone biosynthesis protein B